MNGKGDEFLLSTKMKTVEEKTSGLLGACFEWVSALITAIVIVSIIFSCFVRHVNVSGDSMKSTLHNGDRLLLSNFLYEPQYGDIVVIVRENDTPLIKRVIGMAGDRIRIDGKTGTVYRNNVALHEPYVLGGFTPQNGMNQEVMVSEGTIFVMGDNRCESLDSRMLGPLSLENLAGRIIYRLSPDTGVVTNGE